MKLGNKYIAIIIIIFLLSILSITGLVAITKEITEQYNSKQAKLKQKAKSETIRKTILSENTVIYSFPSSRLTNARCYVVEAKTNGYVDIEIDCK